jgi:hypothetical protein
MTHLCVADWDRLANDVARSGGFYAHCSLMLLGLFTLCLYLCVDLLLLATRSSAFSFAWRMFELGYIGMKI